MKAVALRWILVVLVVAGVLVGCNAGKTGGDAASGETALTLNGMVDKEMHWTEAEIRAMETIKAESTNKEGETKTYTGVPINALLDQAGLKRDAAAVVFVADDGFTAEVTVDDVRGCADCIVSFRNQGGFSIVMPGFPGKVQVRGVVEIQAQ